MGVRFRLAVVFHSLVVALVLVALYVPWFAVSAQISSTACSQTCFGTHGCVPDYGDSTVETGEEYLQGLKRALLCDGDGSVTAWGDEAYFADLGDVYQIVVALMRTAFSVNCVAGVLITVKHTWCFRRSSKLRLLVFGAAGLDLVTVVLIGTGVFLFLDRHAYATSRAANIGSSANTCPYRSSGLCDALYTSCGGAAVDCTGSSFSGSMQTGSGTLSWAAAGGWYCAIGAFAAAAASLVTSFSADELRRVLRAVARRSLALHVVVLLLNVAGVAITFASFFLPWWQMSLYYDNYSAQPVQSSTEYFKGFKISTSGDQLYDLARHVGLQKLYQNVSYLVSTAFCLGFMCCVAAPMAVKYSVPRRMQGRRLSQAYGSLQVVMALDLLGAGLIGGAVFAMRGRHSLDLAWVNGGCPLYPELCCPGRGGGSDCNGPYSFFQGTYALSRSERVQFGPASGWVLAVVAMTLTLLAAVLSLTSFLRLRRLLRAVTPIAPAPGQAVSTKPRHGGPGDSGAAEFGP